MSNAQPTSQMQTGSPDLNARPWLRHYDPAVPSTLTYPDKPLTWLLGEAVRNYSKREAIIFYGHRFTYAQLGAMADRFAAALIELGVKPGDRVSICLPNIPQFPIAFYGALKAGAVVVPTNPIYTESELQHQLADSGAETIVVLDLVYHRLLNVRNQTQVKRVIVAGVQDYLPPLLAAGYLVQQRRARQRLPSKQELRADDTIHQFKDVIGKQDEHWFQLHALPAAAKADDVAVLQYTGGTTGLSKGAMLTHRNLLANAMQAWAWTEEAKKPEVILCAAPFFHSYGLTVAMNAGIWSGSALVLMPRYKARDAIKMIEKYHPTIFPGVPTMYLGIAHEIEQRGGDIRSVRICVSGAAPLPKEVQANFEKLSGGKVVEGYGLSEASPVTHSNPLYSERRTGIGLPISDTEATIQDPETGEMLPPGQPGEICIRGPQVMKGYWNRPEETAKMLRGGWLHTGDIGVMDEDGYFSVVDRAKDMIIASGYKIFPREVEEILYAHPKVAEAVLVGIPDEYRGEAPKAFIVLKPGKQATAEEIIAYCKERLAAYKVPKQVEFRAELPKTLIGKVLRRALREEEAAKRAAGR
ncbi:MAG TPA: long-chain fatty acid--CoA ligase [Ktedonobacterales bacterium]|jgi:long-chain acyl-CoA synthetase